MATTKYYDLDRALAMSNTTTRRVTTIISNKVNSDLEEVNLNDMLYKTVLKKKFKLSDIRNIEYNSFNYAYLFSVTQYKTKGEFELDFDETKEYLYSFDVYLTKNGEIKLSELYINANDDDYNIVPLSLSYTEEYETLYYDTLNFNKYEPNTILLNMEKPYALKSIKDDLFTVYINPFELSSKSLLNKNYIYTLYTKKVNDITKTYDEENFENKLPILPEDEQPYTYDLWLKDTIRSIVSNHESRIQELENWREGMEQWSSAVDSHLADIDSSLEDIRIKHESDVTYIHSRIDTLFDIISSGYIPLVAEHNAISTNPIVIPQEKPDDKTDTLFKYGNMMFYLDSEKQ